MSWVEVYDEIEERWISIDVARNIFNKPHLMEEKKPLPFVTAFNTSRYLIFISEFHYSLYVDDYIKDVSRRYASQWAAKTLRSRPTNTRDWWTLILEKFKPRVLTVMINEKRDDYTSNIYTYLLGHGYT
jgi:hypothetical protein